MYTWLPNKEESLPRRLNSLSIVRARPVLTHKSYHVAGEKEDLCVRLGILQRNYSVEIVVLKYLFNYSSNISVIYIIP